MRHARMYTLTAALGLTALLLVPEAVPMAYAQLPGTTVHVVEPGDTLWSIGERLGVDTSTLVRLNNLDNGDLLSIGQSLKVPAGSDAAATPSPSAPRASTTGSATYTVVGGDTLWSIAERLGVDTGTLVGLNDLDNADLLSIGMVLTVPGAAGAASAVPAAAAPGAPSTAPSPARQHIVRVGETL